MIRNLTPHPIRILRAGNSGSLMLPATSPAARVAVACDQVGVVDGIPVYCEQMGEVQGLPEPEPGTYLIVSRVVAAAAPWRSDILVPGDLVRDEAGNVIGCRGLVRPAVISPTTAREAAAIMARARSPEGVRRAIAKACNARRQRAAARKAAPAPAAE